MSDLKFIIKVFLIKVVSTMVKMSLTTPVMIGIVVASVVAAYTQGIGDGLLVMLSIFIILGVIGGAASAYVAWICLCKKLTDTRKPNRTIEWIAERLTT